MNDWIKDPKIGDVVALPSIVGMPGTAVQLTVLAICGKLVAYRRDGVSDEYAGREMMSKGSNLDDLIEQDRLISDLQERITQLEAENASHRQVLTDIANTIEAYHQCYSAIVKYYNLPEETQRALMDQAIDAAREAIAKETKP